MSIDIDGPRCNCGNFGCLESLASGIALVKRVKQEIHRGAKSSLSDLYLNHEESLTLETIVEHCKKGDLLAESIIDEMGRYLGIGDRKSTRLNSSHVAISYAVFCLKKNKQKK